MTNLSAIRDTEWLLQQWGRWAYSRRGLPLDYPGITAFTRLRGNSLPEPNISDTEGLQVDRAVCGLLDAHPAEGEAVALYFLVTPSYRGVGKLLRDEHGRPVHHRVVGDMVRGGLMWIDATLRSPGNQV